MTPFLAELIWMLAGAGWFAIRYPHQRRSRKTPVARRAGGTRDRVLLGISLAGLGIVPLIYVAATRIWPERQFPADRDWAPWHGWIGLACALAALALFYATHRQLGRFWSVTLDTRKQHKLIDTGVYGLVRHPMYSAFWLLAIAQAGLLANWVAGFAGIVGFGTLYVLRIGREERLMVDTFGDAYRAYMKRTARLVPWVY